MKINIVIQFLSVIAFPYHVVAPDNENEDPSPKFNILPNLDNDIKVKIWRSLSNQDIANMAKVGRIGSEMIPPSYKMHGAILKACHEEVGVSILESLHNPQTKLFVIPTENIVLDCAKAISQLCEAHRKLPTFDIPLLLLKIDGVADIDKALYLTKCRASVHVMGNTPMYRLGEKGSKLFAEIIKTNGHNIQDLNLSNNMINDEGMKYIAEALIKQGKNIKSLFLDYNRLGPDSISYLGEYVAGNTKLESLSIRHNQLENEGAESLGKILGSKNNLRILRLKNNGITAQGIKELAKGLASTNCVIESLDLSDNQWADDMSAVSAFGAALSSEHSTIRKLDLSSCEIDDEFFKHFNSPEIKLTSLKLKDNLIGADGISWLARSTSVGKFPSTLKYLSLSENHLGNEGAAELKHMLSLDKSLEELICDFCGIKAYGIVSLLQAANNGQLKGLSLLLNDAEMGELPLGLVVNLKRRCELKLSFNLIQ